MNKKLSETDLAKIEGLLASNDSSNARLAIELLKTFGLYSEYLTNAAIEHYKATYTKELKWDERETIRKRFEMLTPLEVQKKLGVVYTYRKQNTFYPNSFSFKDYDGTKERRIAANIRRLTNGTMIGKERIASFIWEFFGRGETYFLQYGNREQQTKMIERKISGKRLDLSHIGLSLIPAAIYDFPQIERLNLRNNRLKTLPRMLHRLPKLSTIDVSHNLITKIHPDLLGLLKNLKRLYITGNPIAK